MFEVGFSTDATFDTKNQEFISENKYIYINKLEVYYTKDRIIGFFPFFNNRVADKKIKENSYYNKFINNLSSFKKTLKQKKIELNQDIIYLTEPLSNIKIVYDENSQNIISIKISVQNKPIIFGNQNIENKDKFTALYKKNYFINGMKSTYLSTTDGIPNLSYIKCYYAKNEDLNKYIDIKVKSNFFSWIIKFILIPFYLIYYLIYSFVKIVLFILKLLLIIFLILSPICYLYYKTQNIYNGNYDLTSENSDLEIKNNDTIKIFTDEYGFPHIKANTLEDIYFGLGFAQAKNRLWQIDMNRRIARGMLSEIFGEKTLETDKFMRKIGHNDFAIKQAKFVENNSKYYNLIKAFIGGVNYFAKNFKLPIEYYITFSEFKDYSLEDIIASISMFGMSMCQDYSMETWYQYMEKTIGKEMTQKIIQYRDEGFPYWNTTIITDDELKESFLFKKKEDTKQKKEEFKDNNNIEQNNFKEENKDNNINIGEAILEEKLKTSGASNCWNVDGSFTSSGKPLLCNDPHLPNGMPGMLFIAKLYLPDGNIISGASLPGSPVIITGSNSYISWGITTENSDTADICEELIQGDHYTKDNTKRPLIISKEIINIKNKPSVEIEVQITENGRVFGKSVPSAFTLLNQNHENSLPLSFRIPFMKRNFTSFDFYFRISFAKNKNYFLDYKGLLNFPNVNLHWITKEGEIGWDSIGIITVKNYYNRFCHGYSSEDDIIEYIPEKQMLKLHNPKRGYIVSGNNKPASFNYLYELRGHHNNFRAHRIEELLLEHKNNNKKIGIKDAKKIVNDVKDTNAEYILPKYLSLVEKNSKNINALKNNEYYTMLKNWDYEMGYNSTTATVYSVLERLIGLSLIQKDVNGYDDNKFMAGSVINALHFWNFVSGTIDKIYRGEKIRMKECMLFDEKNNKDDDDCEKYIIKVFESLEENMQKYKDEKGNIIKWGDINFNYFPHTSFNQVPFLNLLFNKKKNAGGNRNTVKISRGPNNGKIGDFYGTQSPRLKFVCDMREPESPYLTISEGNGGNFLQDYYNNFDDKHEDAKLVKFESINFEDKKYQKRIININKKIISEQKNETYSNNTN